MRGSLLLLLALSVGVTVAALVATRLPRLRGRAGRGRSTLTVGVAQLLLGGAWAAWGAFYLQGNSSQRSGGWFAALLGALWCAQGLRRIGRGVRRR